MKAWRETRGEQEEESTEEKDKLLQTAEKKEERKRRLRSMWDSKQASKIRYEDKLFSLSGFLSHFCVAWLCRLAGMYTAQGGQWISLNDTKARKLRLGMKPLHHTTSRCCESRAAKKWEKQLWSALTFSPSLPLLSLYGSLSRPSALFYALFIMNPFSRSISRLSSFPYETSPNMIFPYKLSLF